MFSWGLANTDHQICPFTIPHRPRLLEVVLVKTPHCARARQDAEGQIQIPKSGIPRDILGSTLGTIRLWMVNQSTARE